MGGYDNGRVRNRAGMIPDGFETRPYHFPQQDWQSWEDCQSFRRMIQWAGYVVWGALESYWSDFSWMIGTLLNDRYFLEDELGRGGMGVVYRARDKVLRRPVAVKLLAAEGLGTEGRARLLQEAG